MKQLLLFLFAASSLPLTISAQNTSPYWSLAGNSNATSTSKLGTTNAINLGVYTSNAERIRILASNGNVGIGTTNPASRLQVNAPTGVNSLNAQVNGVTKLLVGSNGGISVGSGTAAPANGLYVYGNVGVGTTAPTQKLHVVGKGLFTTGITVSNGGITTSNTASLSSGINATGTFYGVYGKSTGAGYGIYGTSPNYGVYGESTNGIYGVYGYSPGGGIGVLGQSSNIGVSAMGGNYGVHASGDTGVFGTGNIAISGESHTDFGDGVRGQAYGVTGWGVNAYSAQSYGLYARTGNSRTYAGYFVGNVFSTGSFIPSDRRFKQNIADLNSAMDIISKLQPKTYEYKQDVSLKQMNLPLGKRYGFIAQEVEELLPGLVKETQLNKSSTQDEKNGEVTDFKAVNYTELIPIMIKGMQEQQQIIEQQQQQINELKETVAKQANGQNVSSSSLTSAFLEGSTPNPAKSTALIHYYIPQNSVTANIVFTDMKGAIIKSIPINNKGTGQLNLNIASWTAGTYTFTLYVNGTQADSKKLVITR